MNFRGRMDGATKKETADAALLEQKYGCIVTPFGQGQLPDVVREYLRNHPGREHIYLRWLPDRLAIRPDLCKAGVPECMWLPDSKYSPPDKHDRYDAWLLEKSAHAAHRLQRVALGLPIVYIWPDGRTCSYVEDLADDVLTNGSGSGYGSGTPYWFVPKNLTRSLDDVFGKGIVPIRRKGDDLITTHSVSRHRGGLPAVSYREQMEEKQ